MMAKNKEIPIFFTFDNNYVVPAFVAINSLLRNVDVSLENSYVILIAYDNINEKNLLSLKKIVERYKFASVKFKHVSNFLFEEWNNGNFGGHNIISCGKHQFCKETMYKCFASSIFHEYDALIYSDVDVIFKKDISDLFDVELADNYIAGVHALESPNALHHASHFPEHYFFELRDSYVAGGIWVMNCKKIREDGVENKMIAVMKDDSIAKIWPDQDVMNIACGKNIKHIPLRYISYANIKEIALLDITNYSQEEIWELYFSPTILHYASFKPCHLKSSRLMEW